MGISLKTFENLESNVRGYSRTFPTIFNKASGALLYDEEGNRYFDFFAGAGSLNYGHNHPVLKKKVLDYIEEDGIIHALDMATTAKRRFLEMLDTIILRPRKLPYKVQFPGPTGTNAVEAAFKLARKIKKRSNIISFTNGFHGVTLGSLAATGNSHYRNVSGLPLSHTSFMPYDGYLGDGVDTLEYFRRMIMDSSSGVDLPAAVIVETVQGEGGVNVAGDTWMRDLAFLCNECDIILIIDDIQVGCGRTGPFFSFENCGITPDIVLLSKSISGYGLPMSLVLIKPELDQWEPGEHNGTFRGNNLAFTAATETLKHFWENKSFSENTLKKGRVLRRRLEEIRDAYPAASLSVRGRGMIQGLVCGIPGLASKISRAAFDRGVMVETSGGADQVVKCIPPLVITEDELNDGLDIIKHSVAVALGAEIATQLKVSEK